MWVVYADVMTTTALMVVMGGTQTMDDINVVMEPTKASSIACEYEKKGPPSKQQSTSFGRSIHHAQVERRGGE